MASVDDARTQEFRRKSRQYSQDQRDKVKERLRHKINFYELSNSICKRYPPQKWAHTEFKQYDVPLIGSRKEKNRLSSQNSRNRKMAMDAELETRILVLEELLEPKFVPYLFSPPEALNFPFPFDDDLTITLGGETFSSGKWTLGSTGWSNETYGK